MKENHSFKFEGGKILSSMGATWFVSYMYYTKIDRKHINWKKYEERSSYFDNGAKYHKLWLQEVLKMNENLLKRNTIDIDPIQTKKMAQELLNLF